MNRNFWIVGSFVFFCSCGFSELFSTVGNIHDGCSEVLKEHPDRLEMSIYLRCVIIPGYVEPRVRCQRARV
ncbi:hypothetical protein, partial [uncultured Fibrobacter sp.]|uniref:hypothetical protein n=1 Tax=uncultured Fibrobacter sp. TaxID=261512 RepID=UPI0025F687A2